MSTVAFSTQIFFFLGVFFFEVRMPLCSTISCWFFSPFFEAKMCLKVCSNPSSSFHNLHRLHALPSPNRLFRRHFSTEPNLEKDTTTVCDWSVYMEIKLSVCMMALHQCLCERKQVCAGKRATRVQLLTMYVAWCKDCLAAYSILLI